jgi:type I restriction enzyme M protein
MARAGKKERNTNGVGNGLMALVRELWQAAVNLRGSIEPADYKRYVLPIIFLRFLSLRFEKRRAELQKYIGDASSDYFNDTKALEDPDEYRSAGAFIVPEEACWRISSSMLKTMILRSNSTTFWS